MNKPIKAVFNYFQESPLNWESRLKNLKALGNCVIEIPVLWGVHETIQGMRDFARSPKLRLEKIFSIARSENISIELRLGFPANSRAFPKWTYGTKPLGAVPTVFWDRHDRGFQFRAVPTFTNSDLQLGFCEFIDECLEWIGLYMGGDGPVSAVQIDMGVLSLDVMLATTEPYLKLFQEKYQNADCLNKKFQSSFRTFPNSHPEQLFRTLFEKRPWLAAVNYREFRTQLLNAFICKIREFKNIRHFSGKISFTTGSNGEDSTSEKPVIIDSTFLELFCGERACFYPELHAHGLSAFSYRLAEYFASRIDPRSYQIVSDANLNQLSGSKKRFTTVICGKYLTSNTIQVIEDLARAGSAVFFPFGFPLYSESLDEVAWAKLGQREIVHREKRPFMRVPFSSGSFNSPVGNLPVDVGLWDAICKYEQELGDIP